MKKTKIGFISLFLAVLFGLSAFASVPYATYTYDIDGNLALSPDAYVPDRLIDSGDLLLETPLSNAKDLFVDSQENLYIVDTKNSRILVCDDDYKIQYSISQFYNERNVMDSLSEPQGVFVNEADIYVADTENNRIVVFHRNSDIIDGVKVKAGDFKKIIEQPTSDVFPEGSVYKPVAVAVDAAGRIFVVSSTTTYGVISMDSDGTFLGFLGAQKVTASAFDIFWRNFQTEAQRAQSLQYVSTEYNNITIDESGFIYVTTSTIDETSQQQAIQEKSNSADYAPVKMLNPKGDDVMNRNGFYPPSGEVQVETPEIDEKDLAGTSKIIDVALGPSGMWSIIDEKRSKVFTYDNDGNLLFIFGDRGSQLGNIQNIQSVVYKGTDMLILDKSNDTITIYKRTEYGDTLAAALQNTQARQYDKAEIYWQDILQRNSNFDMAYIGIGDSLYRQGRYEEAMEMYQMAYAVEDYSNSFKQIRKDWMSKYIWIVPVVAVLAIVLVSKFFKFANKINVAGQKMREKRKFHETLLYGFHIIFHPFDGFWDMKHEKRGSMSAALTIVAITILSFIYKSAGTAYIFNPESIGVSYMGEILGVILPYVLGVIANWCLTTLFDGEGRMSDIFMACGYALLPIPLMIVPTTICSNFLLLEEGAILTMINAIGYIWAGALIFFALQVIHDYQLGKNVVMCISTIVGMAFIMFLGVLFSGLLGKIVSFVYNVYIELSYRL